MDLSKPLAVLWMSINTLFQLLRILQKNLNTSEGHNITDTESATNIKGLNHMLKQLIPLLTSR